jgi:hypothetical protein
VRATGRPIFLSDIPVHREQNPMRCTYFDAESDQLLASAIANQWADLHLGPEIKIEKSARVELADQVLKSGKVFIDIAREALLINELKLKGNSRNAT